MCVFAIRRSLFVVNNNECDVLSVSQSVSACTDGGTSFFVVFLFVFLGLSTKSAQALCFSGTLWSTQNALKWQTHAYRIHRHSRHIHIDMERDCTHAGDANLKWICLFCGSGNMRLPAGICVCYMYIVRRTQPVSLGALYTQHINADARYALSLSRRYCEFVDKLL